MKVGSIDISDPQLVEVCRRWRIVELSLFGSALRSDFGPDSDVDLLVRFADGVHLRLADWGQLDDDLRQLFGRDVDLVERSAVEAGQNFIRRNEILRSAKMVYAA